MFKINRRTDYAARVLLCLAKQAPGARLATQVVQREMLIPPSLLQRIVADLARAGLINTFAGPGGGLELARPAQDINLRQVWEAIEGPLLISDCLKSPGTCPLDQGCPVHGHWGRLQALIAGELEAIRMDTLAVEAARLAGAQLARGRSQNTVSLEQMLGVNTLL